MVSVAMGISTFFDTFQHILVRILLPMDVIRLILMDVFHILSNGRVPTNISQCGNNALSSLIMSLASACGQVNRAGEPHGGRFGDGPVTAYNGLGRRRICLEG
jgi:hypothetical protein